MPAKRGRLAHVAFSLAAVAKVVHAWQEQCDSYQLQAIDGVDATLDFTRYYAAGSLVNLTSPGGAVTTSDLPAFCRVKLLLHTSPTSKVETEVWLPDDWNTRTVGFGNGGWNGGVVFDSLAYAGVSFGYSSFSTNNWVNTTALDGSPALNNPDGLIDNSYRAMHQSSVAARAVTQQYYDKEAYKNYYLGCSTGGRQGLASITLYPEDFDGVVVGSPATPWRGLQTWSIWIDNIALPVNGSTWIGAEDWQTIHKGVLEQCDELDGIADGVISDPPRCNFRPELLACRPGQKSGCLSLGQISTIKKMYKPLYGSSTDDPSTLDTLIFPGYEPGGETEYANGLVGPAPLPISTGYFKYAVYNDSNWDPSSLSFQSWVDAGRINPGTLNLDQTNITAFANRGGKILHYVGWADQLISAGNSIKYADDVTAFTLANSKLDPQDFYKLYTIPGMGHCSGGPGAYAMGGEGQRPSTPPLKRDSKHDIFLAMVEWVEQDKEPQTLVATKYSEDDVSQGTAFTRPICIYPKSPRYISGDKNSASSFECV